MDHPSNNIDPEIQQMLAAPEFLAEPVFSKENYLTQIAIGLLGSFLRMSKQAPEVFKQVQKAHEDSHSNCFKAMVSFQGARFMVVAWSFDLDALGPNGQTGRDLFLDRAKSPRTKLAGVSSTEIREQVLGRRVLRIQVDPCQPQAKLATQYEISHLKNIGWYAAGLVMPNQSLQT